mgnify:CR=1 FL=1
MLEFRQFDSVEQMNSELVAKWNSIVGGNDTVFILGDVSFADKNTTVELLSRLRGNIHLIAGNHDKQTRRLDIFQSVQDYAEITVNDQFIVMSHYPLLTWNKSHYGSWNLHGHSHGNINDMNKDTTRIDVGVDSFDYKPVPFTLLKEIMDKREYKAVDHHR